MLFISTSSWALSPEYFPVDPRLRVRVNFWKKVYTEIHSYEAYLHDSDDLSIIYGTVNYKGKSRRQKNRLVRAKRNEIRDRLLSLVSKNKQNLNNDEEILLLMIKDPPISRIRELAQNIRVQQGLLDRYLAGLSRSFLYIDKIREIIEEFGLPQGLAYLPHVESSFNYLAYSKVGAAGIWQFMRSTGRTYGLKLNYVIDERRDPIAATHAAAKFLRDNYRRLGTWPLALTAYNHGPLSIERAKRKVGTSDIAEIIEKYNGRRFGFASKNFYATFVATAEISESPLSYFKDLKKPKPIPTFTIPLPKPLTTRQISKSLGISNSEIRDLNLSLRPVAFRANLYIPKGFPLKINNRHAGRRDRYLTALNEVKGGPERLKSGGIHLVSRGENLYWIARMYKTSITNLIVLNQLSSPSKIYPGMTLKIPGEGVTVKPTIIAKAETQKEKQPGLIAESSLAKKESNENIEIDQTIKVDSEIEDSQTEIVSKTVEVKKEEEKGIFSRVAGLFFGKKAKEKAIQKDEEEPKLLPKDDIATTAPLPQTPLAVEFDPSNYNLDTKELGKNIYQIKVETDETLGHYADWLGIPTQAIRRTNRMRFGQPIRQGQFLKIPMNESELMSFNLKRIQYHQAIEEDLYNAYKISGTTEYIIKSGDTIGDILRDKEVPFWLLRKYQESGFSEHLSVGQVLKIPNLKSLNQQDEDEDLNSEEVLSQ